MEDMFLGIDTSCYTTSLAVVTRNRKLLVDKRRILKVPLGEKGLQQAMAVFQHLQNLPPMLEELVEEVSFQDIKLIAASALPRSVKGSYMPVFTVSEGQARILASAMEVTFKAFSHQEGHLRAGLWSSGKELNERFLAVHLSGGTSELLIVEFNKGKGFNIKLMGGTTDLHAGQFVDRIGVRLGLKFPAGKELEKLASHASGTSLKLSSSVRGYDFSFSGPESQAARLLEKGEEPSHIARSVEHCIAKTIEKVARKAVEETGVKDILLVGGVASNTYIRVKLEERLSHRAVNAKLFFAHPRFSTDNAVGVALLGKDYFQRERQQ